MVDVVLSDNNVAINFLNSISDEVISGEIIDGIESHLSYCLAPII